MSGTFRTYDVEATTLTDDSFLYEIGPQNAPTFTVTINSPAVFTISNHNLAEGTPVAFKTTGALPTGLSVGVTYYIIAAGLGANTFEVSTSPGGSAVITTGSQSPTHSIFAVRQYVVGDQVLKSNAAAGGSPGWVCTTGGVALGTAVFKALANVAA
jgi:hypothetical protein